MPTAKELEEHWKAQFHFFGGPPPDEQHNMRMLEDPAYRAAYEAGQLRLPKPIEYRDGAQQPTHTVSNDSEFILYYDKINRRIVKICHRMESAIHNTNNEIIGVAEYDPKTWRETFTCFPPRRTTI